MTEELAAIREFKADSLSGKERIARLEVAVALLIQAAIPDNWLERNALMKFVGLNGEDARRAWMECQKRFREGLHYDVR